MAISPNVFRNLGKSVAYSSLEVMSSLTPNTSELIRGARSGVDATRDFIRMHQSKMKITTTQYDRTTVARKAKSYIQDAWKDVKSGNLSLGNLVEDSREDWESSESDESYADQRISDDGDVTVANQSASAMADYRILEGMSTMGNTLASTTLKATEYQTQQITNAIFTQMASQNQHFLTIERQLDSINKNLVQLVKFQGESQGVLNQATLSFYDSMTRWMDRQEKRATERAKTTKDPRRNPMSRFISDAFFDVDTYKGVVKSNMENSPMGQLLSMLSMLDPAMVKMSLEGPNGKIQPQRFVLNALIKALIPAQARRSLNRGDKQMNTMAKTLLTRLGSYRYKMDSNPILGVLGSLFGIDPKLNRSINLGNYKKGEMSWNGEAQRALTVVIPKELAEIKAAITGQTARYHDYETGKFFTADEIRERTRVKYQDMMEVPFANIFSKVSLNPDDKANTKFWTSMSADVQNQVSAMVNEAVRNAEGMSTDIANAMNDLIMANIEGIGGTVTDAQRMVMTLTDAVNEARSRTANMIAEMEATNGAFAQVASDMANSYGRISYDALQKYIGANGIDLAAANSDKYTKTGKRREALSQEQLEVEEASERLLGNSISFLKNLKNSDNMAVRLAGNALEKVINIRTGANTTKYSRAISGGVDKFWNQIYNVTMLGGTKGRTAAASGGVPPVVVVNAGGEEKETIAEQPRPATSSSSKREPKGRITLKPMASPIEQEEENTSSQKSAAGGIVNAEYAKSTNQLTPEEQTAENTEKMAEQNEEFMGPKGYLTRLFRSKGFKSILSWLEKSKLGETVKGGAGKLKNELKKIFTNKDENGNEQNSVLGNFKELFTRYKKLILSNFGYDVDKDTLDTENPDNPAGAAAQVSESLKATAEALAGTSDPKEAKAKAKREASSILKSITDIFRKKAPKVATGGILGAAAGLAMGGSTGLLGKLFLPGGPIGGAIIGMGLSILTDTEAFKSVMFGKMGKDGEREGGIISKKMSDGFKKVLPTLGLGATAGVILKLLGNATGISAGPFGIVTKMLLPGGIMGAAIVGAAGAFALRNEKVQNILFGEADDDGKRSGAFLSNMYNKLTGKIKSETANKGGKKSLGKKIIQGVKGAAIGAVSGAVLKQMGILGSAASFGGPIGAAIMGAALGIASSSGKFNEYLFGTEDENGKRKKDGLFSRFSTMLQLNVLEPAKNWLTDTGQEFVWWAKEKIEIPFRLALGPILDSFQDLKDSMKETATGVIKKGGEFIGKKIEKILTPIGSAFMKFVLKPLGSLAGNLVKGGLFAGASLVGAPFQLLSLLMSGKRRKGQKLFGDFLKGNKESNLERYWAEEQADGKEVSIFDKAGDRFKYTLATMPVVGNLFRSNEMIAEMADYYGETPEGEGRNNLDWLGAGADKKRYKKARKDVRGSDEAKEQRRILKLRQQWAKESNYVDGVVDPEVFEARKKYLKKKYDIDIADQEELRKFTYDYDAWKNPKPVEETEEGKTDIFRDEIKQKVDSSNTFLESILERVTMMSDVVKGMFDKETGAAMDTEDIDPGEVAETMDTEAAQDIQEAEAATTANAFGNVVKAQAEQAKKDAEHAAVTGNTSGNAHDEDPEKLVADAININGDSDADQSDTSSNGILSGLTSGLSSGIFSIIGRFITSAGGLATIAAGALALVLSNSTAREALGNLIGSAVKSIPEFFGADGGVNNTRATEIDEETGEVTQSVANDGMYKQAVAVATNLPSAAKAAGTLAKTFVPGAKTVSKLWSGAKDVASKAAESATTQGGLLNKIFSFIKTGLEKACTTKIGQGVSNIISKVSSFFDDLLAKFAKTKLGETTMEALTKVASGAGIITTVLKTAAAVLNIINTAVNTLEGALMPEKLFKIDESYVDAKMRVIAAVINFLLSFTGMGAVVGLINEIVTEVIGIDFIRSLAMLLYNAIASDEDDAKLAEAVAEMDQEVANYNEANGTNLSLDAYNDLKNKGIWGGAINWVKNLFGKGDTTDYDQYKPENYNSSSTSTSNSTTTSSSSFSGTNNGAGRAGTGTVVGYGPALQADSRWANKPIGTFPNGQISTMATGGCGPTALANAASALGLGADPSAMADFAMQNGYIAEGGASENFFDVGVNQLGLDSQRVGSSEDIASSLMNGRPVILAGKSSGYGPTPYTSAGHIVTATGMDSKGNVTVQDPMRGTGTYKLNDLQKKMTGGWSIGRGPGRAAGYGLIDTLLGGAFNGLVSNIYSLFGVTYDPDTGEATVSNAPSADGSSDDSTSSNSSNSTYTGTYTAAKLNGNSNMEQIWNYLTGDAGFSKYAASGIMGCWQAESSNNPDTIEGFYLKGFPGTDAVLASSEALDNYTVNTLFPAYAKSGLSINKNGYLGNDGHYYPGFGLAQWTGPRGYNLFSYAKQHGVDWRTLNAQLPFFMSEIEDRGIKETLNSATSPEDGALLALDNYEMYKGYGSSHPDKLADRANPAASIYDTYKDYTAPTTESASYGKGPAGYGLLDTMLGGAFEALISSAYNKFGVSYNSDDATSSGSSGSATSAAANTTASSTAVNDTSLIGQKTNSAGVATDLYGAKYYPKDTVSSQQQALVNQMNSIYGQINYSLEAGKQDPDKGVASCASTVAWAYNKVLGFRPNGQPTNNNYAGSTAQSTDDRFVTIYNNDGNGWVDTSTLQPGDIVYQNWDRTVNNGTMQHTEMYAGNDTTLSHGGNPRYGPTSKPIDSSSSGGKYRLNHTMMVRRYKGFMMDEDTYNRQLLAKKQSTLNSRPPQPGTETQTAVAFGPGPKSNFSLNTTGQYQHRNDLRSYGYGPGAQPSDNSGVTSRLDVIISALKQIVELADKKTATPVNTTNNITANYGAGPQVTNKPTVIVNNSNRHLGEKDASNEYLRTRHRTLARASHS